MTLRTIFLELFKRIQLLNIGIWSQKFKCSILSASSLQYLQMKHKIRLNACIFGLDFQTWLREISGPKPLP